jgi:enoyl-CoA hydratase
MITIDDRTGVTVVSLARPPVNALDLSMIEELESIFAGFAGRASPSGVVLTGTGSSFCAGVDTKAFMSYDRDARRRMVLAITRMTQSILSLSSPLVAAVNGHALGGGFVLMLCADYRLAVDDNTVHLGLTEARAGVPFPAGPVAVMKHEVPPGLLRQLTLSSRVMSPQDLVPHAVIDALTSSKQIVEQAVAAARDLASQPAFAVVKRQVRGRLVAELRSLADAGSDPFLASFG